MRPAWLPAATASLAAGLAIGLGGLVLVRSDIAQRREAFQAEARAAHRLLSQRMAQHEAILATLALPVGPRSPGTAPGNTPGNAPGTATGNVTGSAPGTAPAITSGSAPGADTGPRPLAERLPPGFPQLVAAWRLPTDDPTGLPDPALAPALAQLRETAAATPDVGPRPAPAARLGPVDAATGRYWLLLPTPAAVHALQVDARRLWTPGDAPFAVDGPEAVRLLHPGGALELQAGAPQDDRPRGLTAGFTFAQPLASDSQPFGLQVQRATGPAEWPWTVLAAWSATCVALSAIGHRLWRERRAARRAAELSRLSQVARLNTLGEMAAGIAHELNQPLTAVLAGTQTALRLAREQRALAGRDAPSAASDADEAPDDDALPALELAAAQARRAADVVARLRRLVQPAPMDTAGEPVDLAALAGQLVGWMQPGLARQGIGFRVEGQAPPVRADRVAVEQILHNLLLNATQALQAVPPDRRQIVLELSAAGPRVRAVVRDSGPGVAAEHRARLFEPFFTTRPDGLGLGLPLCQSLAQALGGQLELEPAAAGPAPGGAAFVLILPTATRG